MLRSRIPFTVTCCFTFRRECEELKLKKCSVMKWWSLGNLVIPLPVSDDVCLEKVPVNEREEGGVLGG